MELRAKAFPLLLLGCVLTASCGGPKVKRILENDPMLRVFLDPQIPTEHYVQIRRALVQSNKFEVVDRGNGFGAILKEQELQHKSGYADRFPDRERWMQWGKLYGAAAVISAHATCYQAKSFWTSELRKYCKQDLAFINGMTGVVEFEVAGENSEPLVVGYSVPDWDSVVQKAVEAYPEYFKVRTVQHPLDQFVDQAEENARREREKATPASQSSGKQNVSPGDLKLLKEAQENYVREQSE